MLLQQHRLVAFLQELLIQILILRHHHVHLPLQHVMDMDQLRIPIHLHLWATQVLLDLLQEHIHNMMSIMRTCANTLRSSQLIASYTQTLSRQLSPRNLTVPLTLSMEHLFLMLTVQHLMISMIGSIKVLISSFYQQLQKDSHHLHTSDIQVKLQPIANSPGTAISGMAEQRVFKHSRFSSSIKQNLYILDTSPTLKFNQSLCTLITMHSVMNAISRLVV